MKFPTVYSASIFLLAVLTGCTHEANEFESADLVITNVQIINIEQNRVEDAKNVFIRDGKIVHIDDSESILSSSKNTVETIDGTGKFLLPGFWDNHVHFRGGSELIEENKNLLPLYIVNGVTTVRDAGGDLTLSVLEWRKEIEAGNLTGPNIFTSGPKLDGPNASWDGSIELESSEEVSAAIDSLENIGADYVKIYDSTLSGEVFLAIVDEAEQRGLPVTGHMPYSVLFGETVERGLDATEHMYYVLKGSSSEEEEITNEILEQQYSENPLGFWEALQGILDSYSDDQAAETYQKMIHNQTAVIPTLHIGETLSTLKATDHSGDEYLE